MINNKMAAGAGIAIAGALAFFAYRHFSTARHPFPSMAEVAGVTANKVAPESPSAENNRQSAAMRTPQNTALKARLFTEYRCQKPSCNMSPFLAENENEALWLRQRGYPSEQQREEAKRLPTVELKSRADKGDLIAASLYGERLMEEGDWTKPYPLLLGAANKGSLYALYALSYRSLNHPEHPDYTSARAYLRLAYLAGDYKATIQLTQTVPHMNGQAEQLIIDAEAAHKFRNLLQYRSYPRPPSKL